MNLKVLLENIDRHLTEKKVKGNAISNKANRQDAIRNLRRYVSGELQGSWSLDTLFAIAKALDTEPWELLRPPGAISRDEASDRHIRRIVDEELAARERGRSAKNRKSR